jgi:hypothetical protein
MLINLMKANFKMINLMEEENLYTPTEIHTMALSKRIKSMVQANTTHIKHKISLKGLGITT